MIRSGVIGAFILLLLPVSSFACRCEQLPLAQYYEQAAFVAMARLVDAHDEAERRALAFELMTAPYKGGNRQHVRGSILQLYSQLSTASCGIQPDLNAIYVVFARPTD